MLFLGIYYGSQVYIQIYKNMSMKCFAQNTNRSCILDIPHIPLFQLCYGAFPLQDLARLSTVWLDLVRPGSLYAAFPLQFSTWGSNYSNAV